MLECPKCGAENLLGRVFCAGCGAKLDLSALTSDVVMEQSRPNFFQLHWRKMVGVLVVAVLATISLAFWPQTAPLAESGSSAGASRVRSRIRTLANQASGRILRGEFAQEDVNAYLQHSRIRRTRIKTFSVAMRPGVIKARMLLPVKEIRAGSKKLVLNMSYDVVCVPVGGQLYVSSASIGHLPVGGPLKGLAVKPFLKLLSNKGDEADLLSAASDIQFEEGKAVVTVGE